MNLNNADMGRPGQQLLPGYVVKLLKTLKIPFGTDRTMGGVDVDPSIALISHIIDCLGALRDVNKVYRSKGSLASRSVGTRVMFGFTAELGNILLDAITFDPPTDLSDSSTYYAQISASILNVFPEIAAQVTPSTGKVLIHHTSLKASATMAMDSIKIVIKAFPAGAWTTDRTGALPLHWITHNPACTQEMINFLINANPKGPWVADMDGYLPLHWAVNHDEPNIDVVAALINANASACAKCCLKGSLALHWCLNRNNPSMAVLKALLQVHSDAVRTFDKTGWLPIHQCVNRSDISLDALRLLIELYPQGLQCPNVNGQLPIHRALDQNQPHAEAIMMMLEGFPGGAKVADDEGYLPIHLALDCARPNPTIAKMLIDYYPESAFHKSKDGLLPIHCIISSMAPVVEIIQFLLQIFPDSVESMAVDVIPVDETADPETWEGEWIEKRWTPLSRAIDRGLDAVVMLFRDALYLFKQQERERQSIQAPNTSNVTNKTLQPQSKPPINNITNMMQNMAVNSRGGPMENPSTSSVEGGGSHDKRYLMTGGNLDHIDSPSHQNIDDDYASDQYATDQERQRLRQQADRDPRQASSLRDRMPGGNAASQGQGQGQPKERRRDPSREKGGRGTRDASRDRRHDSRDKRGSRDRDRSNGRGRLNRYSDDEDGGDYDGRGDKRRHRDRSSSRNHRGGADRERDRRDSKDRRERDRDNFNKDRSSNRVYEQTDYDDDRDERDDADYNAPIRDPKATSSSGKMVPTAEPPQSMLAAANANKSLPRPNSAGSGSLSSRKNSGSDRPGTRRGISNAEEHDVLEGGNGSPNSRGSRDMQAERGNHQEYTGINISPRSPSSPSQKPKAMSSQDVHDIV
jgi:hypothetical protein